ncbi:Wzz/FepE/Etk N-terminal domain-containing protein [Roseburia hominis]
MENIKQSREDGEVTIDLLELFTVLLGKAHIILLAGVFTALLALVGTKMLLTPMYRSVTKVYVLSKQDNTASVTYSDLQTGTQLVKDYMELVKSRPVLEQTISVLNLDMEPEELKERITTETSGDTRIFSISVVDEDPKKARDIVNAVREAVSIQITEVMDADAVNTVEEGNLPKSPASPSLKKNAVIGGLLGVIVAAGIFVLIFLLDDTIKTPADVERYLDLNVLASIPISEGEDKSRRAGKRDAKKLSNTRKRR